MDNRRASPPTGRRFLTETVRLFVDLLFPARCVACGRAGARFCPVCAQQVEPVPDPVCDHCGRTLPDRGGGGAVCRQCGQQPPSPLVRCRAAALHAEPLRAAIHALKYNRQPELADDLARYLVAAFRRPGWTEIAGHLDACAPVPLHPERLRERGYNQSALLAAAFGRIVGLPVMEGALERVRATRSQVGLSAAERRQNVADAFVAAPQLAGKQILLIDDVFTTGATMSSCAQAARDAGVKAVYGLTLAMPLHSAPNHVA